MQERRIVGIEQRQERVADRRPPRPSARRSRSCGPSRAQPRRHACSSHRPPMFFSSRVVPQTPPSLVKFASSARGVMIGRGTSVPSSDQVPELRNARPPYAGDRRHRRSGVVTGRRDDRRARRARRATRRLQSRRAPCPARSAPAAAASAGRGRAAASIAQFRVRASTICVVVALVYSARSSPVSQ